MSDPFQDQHKAAERKAEQAKAAQQVVARDQRVTASKTRRESLARPTPAYPYPKGFYRL